jgi:hypothetical protein
MPDVTLTETVTVTSREISDEERVLANKYNALVARCLEWADQQMRYGSHSTKLTLTKSVVSAASRLAALDTKIEQEQHRLAFQALLQQVTRLDANDAVTVNAISESALDQD